MKENLDKVLLEDMIQSVDKILSYLETTNDLQEFLANEMLIDAVTRNFEIIGEAANKISEEIKEINSNVPWSEMYGLRNLAAHEYHSIDPAILWEIATEHLVQNKIDLEDLLEKVTNENH